jgi:hypothetical protein
MKHLFALFLVTLLMSCIPKEQLPKESTPTDSELKTENVDAAKTWIENIFKCKSEDHKYCFYLDNEEELCTKRFYDFMVDSEELYGASNLTEEELPAALTRYKQKWSNIYNLRKDEATWLFGRGQDDMENIQTIQINKVADLKYGVDVDYGEGIKTKNVITLVKEGDSYKIDYCETEFVE